MPMPFILHLVDDDVVTLTSTSLLVPIMPNLVRRRELRCGRTCGARVIGFTCRRLAGGSAFGERRLHHGCIHPGSCSSTQAIQLLQVCVHRHHRVHQCSVVFIENERQANAFVAFSPAN